MRRNWFAISTLAVSLVVPAGLLSATAHATPANPAAGFHQDRDRDWDQPPDEFRDVQRQGFHDGIEAARSDYDRHRHKDADDHERYRHPPVDRSMREDYRQGFRRGYEVAMQHLNNDHHDHDRDHD